MRSHASGRDRVSAMLPARRPKCILLLPGAFVTPPANGIVSLACGHMARRRGASLRSGTTLFFSAVIRTWFKGGQHADRWCLHREPEPSHANISEGRHGSRRIRPRLSGAERHNDSGADAGDFARPGRARVQDRHRLADTERLTHDLTTRTGRRARGAGRHILFRLSDPPAPALRGSVVRAMQL